jgi:type IV pilus assembly protein PilC
MYRGVASCGRCRRFTKDKAVLSTKLPLTDLIELCRVLRHYLGSGLTLRDAITQQARKGRQRVRPIAERISHDLEQGIDLETALAKEQKAFPPLFVSLATVGEQSGNMPEIFGELERYYLMQQKLTRLFLMQIAWPVFQFVAAIFVIAGLLFVLGLIADSRGGKPLDPLGLGLTGPKGAMIFLSVVFGLLALLAVSYWIVTRHLNQKASFDRLMLSIPVLGPCFRALALSRFCLALRLTMETGMSITRAMRLALAATGNAAYEIGESKVRASLKAGDDLTKALWDRALFPEEFQNIVAVAEESGRLHDVLDHQTEHYQDESRRRLLILTNVAAWGVWLLVAILIIIAIFRIFLIAYLGPINEMSNF